MLRIKDLPIGSIIKPAGLPKGKIVSIRTDNWVQTKDLENNMYQYSYHPLVPVLENDSHFDIQDFDVKELEKLGV